jgi:hypothetical protein
MSQQQPNESKPNESKPSQKGGAGNASQKPDKSNEILQKSGNQSAQQSGQQSRQDSQQKRDAHSNSASAGSDEDSDARGGVPGSTKNLETEPDRAARGK